MTAIHDLDFLWYFSFSSLHFCYCMHVSFLSFRAGIKSCSSIYLQKQAWRMTQHRHLIHVCGIDLNYWMQSNGRMGFMSFRFRIQFSSVQFSHSVMSDSLQPHESQHARPPCPSSNPGVHSNSCPSSRWCHPAISSSVIPFSSCLQSLPASESFPMSQLFAWGGQSIGVSTSTSVLPMNTQDWSPLGWTGWISLQSKGHSIVFSNTTVQKHQFFGAQFSSQSNSHIHTWPLEKP